MSESILKNAQHTNKAFDESLKELNNSVLEMGVVVSKMFEYVRKSFNKPSKATAAAAKKLDKKLNALDFDVQQRTITMIALRQPMGVDLRFLVAVLKISSSMERMGDLAKSSCRKASRFGVDLSDTVTEDLIEMIGMAEKMLHDTMSAFQELSIEKANDILDQDDDMDDLYHALLQDVQKLVEEKPQLIPIFADIIFAAKNMERIGDHCTKLANFVHYVANGEHVGKAANAEKQFKEAKAKKSKAKKPKAKK